MGFCLLILFLIMELTLLVSSFTKCKEKRDWLLIRMIVRVSELAAFLLVMLLPNVTFDFKYSLCFWILMIRVVKVVILYFVERNTISGSRSKAGAVFAALSSIAMLGFALIPSFLFAEYDGLPTSGPYNVKQTAAILIDESRIESFETDGSYREVPVHFYYPEVSENETQKFPLVVFSHGAFGYYQSNTSTYQELASNGYVVVSLDHPYHSFFTNDTNGEVITVNPQFLQEVMYVNEDSTPEAEINELSHKWLAIRLDDLSYAIDSIKEAKAENTLSSNWFMTEKNGENDLLKVLFMTDIEKIGVMGHSLGGAASVTLGRERDDIDAVIDLDGTMLGEQISFENGEYQYNDEPYPVPILAIDTEYHYTEAQNYGNLYVNNEVLSNAVDARHTYFKNSGHMNFTDLPLFAPALAEMLGIGEIDATECIKTTNEIVLEYMNHYLKGEGDISLRECY